MAGTSRFVSYDSNAKLLQPSAPDFAAGVATAPRRRLQSASPCYFASLDVANDRQYVIDSLPMLMIQFYLVPSATSDWKAYESTFGKVPSRKQAIFGYKLHLLIA